MRSLIEPLRKIVARLHGHYICGKAVDIVMGERLLEVETTGPDGEKHRIYVPYVYPTSHISDFILIIMNRLP